MIPLYRSTLCVGLDRGAYCVLPAASSRCNWPVSIQWWFVRRLILNSLASSAFVTRKSKIVHHPHPRSPSIHRVFRSTFAALANTVERTARL